MSQKTKIILIVVAIVLILCTCAAFCGAAVIYLGNSMNNQANEVKDGLLMEVCKSHGDFDTTEYKAWFSRSYRDSVDYTRAKRAISDAFPNDFECTDLEAGNIINMLLSGQSISIQSSGGTTTAEFSYKKEDNETVTFNLEEVGNEWEIDSVTLTRKSG